MTGDAEKPAQGKGRPAGNDKAERLAAALRANLKRRKEQQRGRADSGGYTAETPPKSR